MNSVECSPGSKFALQKRDKKIFIQTVNPIRTNKQIVLLAFHRHEELDRRLMASNAAAAVLRSRIGYPVTLDVRTLLGLPSRLVVAFEAIEELH